MCNPRFARYLQRHRRNAVLRVETKITVATSTPSTSGGTEEMFTLEEAFSYDGGGPSVLDNGKPLDLQKAVLSIAFLLDWASDIGNRPVDGTEALGLSFLLRRVAKDIDRIDRDYKYVFSRLSTSKVDHEQ